MISGPDRHYTIDTYYDIRLYNAMHQYESKGRRTAGANNNRFLVPSSCCAAGGRNKKKRGLYYTINPAVEVPESTIVNLIDLSHHQLPFISGGHTAFCSKLLHLTAFPISTTVPAE
jgi:hypothetical protein